MDAAQMDDVRDRAAGGELLRARDDNAVIALLDHAGIERRVALLVRGLAAVDLRRDDGVGGVEVIVAQVLVERDHVVREILPARGQYARGRGIAAEEAGDMVGGAAHQAERRLRPGLGKQASRPQISMAARDLVGAKHRLAGFGRDERHARAHLRRRRDVVESCDRARRLAEREMRSHVLDAFAVDEHLPSVIERAKIVGAGSHTWIRLARLFDVQDFTPLAMSSTSLCGVIGVCAMRTPKGCNAFSMAEITAAAVGMVLTSPAPLAPSGLSGDGVSL